MPPGGDTKRAPRHRRTSLRRGEVGPITVRVRTRVAFGCVLLLLATQSHHAIAQAAKSRDLGEVWLEGTVGTAAVRMYLGDAGWPRESGIQGIYYYTKYWMRIPLDGDWVDHDHLRLVEGDSTDSTPQPRLDLALSNSQVVTGTWTAADGARTVPVRLRRVSKPAGFDIAIRQPSRFADPDWPITIDYPRGWRLDASSREVTLRSRDPQDMLFDNELHCQQGSGVPDAPGPEEPDEPFIWPFYWAQDGWRVGNGQLSECRADSCERPEIRQGGPGTFMHAEAGYRMYSPWGYAGQASTEAYLIVIGDRWVSCTDRLLDSHQRITVRARTPGK